MRKKCNSKRCEDHKTWFFVRFVSSWWGIWVIKNETENKTRQKLALADHLAMKCVLLSNQVKIEWMKGNVWTHISNDKTALTLIENCFTHIRLRASLLLAFFSFIWYVMWSKSAWGFPMSSQSSKNFHSRETESIRLHILRKIIQWSFEERHNKFFLFLFNFFIDANSEIRKKSPFPLPTIANHR